MSPQPQTEPAQAIDAALDAEIDAVLEEFGHDPRRAIAALLQDLGTLAADLQVSVSTGFVRGRQIRVVTRVER